MKYNQRVQNTAPEGCTYKEKISQQRPSGGFSDMKIAPSLLREINRLGFSSPTPIQHESIPAGIQGNDIIAIAQTGSGKTLAFGIPMLQRLSQNKDSTGLVLVPTRELALQVNESLKAFTRPLRMDSVVLIGGASITVQRNVLKKNPQLIIATPGRLMDHIARRTVDLSDIEVFILDEADRMLDMGFVNDIKKIIKSIPENRQTMLFSATMPREIEAIAKQLMESPTRFEVDRSGATPAEVSHEMFCISRHDKKRLLAVQLKEYTGPVLVFTRTKRMASKLTSNVNSMGFAAAEIHSDRSQGQRQHALDGFKRGRYQILIATDIAARGIDVSGIELVVNYDMPANSEDYVHRIGRTGRAGKTGHAISYATSDQMGYIKSLERFMKTKMAISEIPPLPSERYLLKKARRSISEDSTISDYRPSRQKAEKGRPAKRKDAQKKYPKSKYSSRHTKLQSAIFDQSESQGEYPIWSNFKKKRSSKKKSVGQGLRRKKRGRSK